MFFFNIFISMYNKKFSLFHFALCTKSSYVLHCAFYCMIL